MYQDMRKSHYLASTSKIQLENIIMFTLGAVATGVFVALFGGYFSKAIVTLNIAMGVH